nr:hypothetical protein [Tanacetum cinerariifolium]
KSPLDFADEAEASFQETAAPEVPSPEEVPISTVPGGDQAAPVVVEPLVQESRKRGREGIDANAPQSHCGGIMPTFNLQSLEALLEIEADMKRAAEEKSAGLSQELERMCAQFSKLQVSNERLSQQVDALQQQVSREETLKAAFEDYKRHQDQMVEQRCAEMDARLDAMSIDFDEELYPHMLTAIAGRRWVIGHGLRLATMKCAESLEMRQAFTDVVSAGIAKGMSEGLKHGVEHGHAKQMIESLEAYDPEAEAKFAAAFQSLKDLKLPLLD